MALKSSDAFEEYRKKLINELIEHANPQVRQRLLGMQFRIDMERRKAKTPIASCMKLFDLMVTHIISEHVPIIEMCISFPSIKQRKKNNKKANIKRLFE